MGTQLTLPIQENVPEIPPWGTDLFLTRKPPIQKKDAMENPTYARHLLVEVLSDLPVETPIYFTDDSTDIGEKQLALGLGCPQKQIEESWKLERTCSSTTAELHAIDLTLSLHLLSNDQQAAIVSDSLAGLQMTDIPPKENHLLSTRTIVAQQKIKESCKTY